MMIANFLLPLLIANGPAAEHKDKLMVFGQLVGQWKFVGKQYNENGSETTDAGEIQIGWILGGRALQDVWLETDVSAGHPEMFGTTVRFYDPKIDAWHSVWSNPSTGTMRTFIGRATSTGIAFEGQDSAGRPIRWAFTKMAKESFRWHAEREVAPGVWHIYEDLHATRKSERTASTSLPETPSQHA
jgi:hypothetical protein